MSDNQYFKRDVKIAQDQLTQVIKTCDNLNKIKPTRSMSIVLTNLQTAELWLHQVMSETVESQ